MGNDGTLKKTGCRVPEYSLGKHGVVSSLNSEFHELANLDYMVDSVGAGKVWLAMQLLS